MLERGISYMKSNLETALMQIKDDIAHAKLSLLESWESSDNDIRNSNFRIILSIKDSGHVNLNRVKSTYRYAVNNPLLLIQKPNQE